jgi:hypothetical protein
MGLHHLHQVTGMEVGAIDENHPPTHGMILEQRKRDERCGVVLRDRPHVYRGAGENIFLSVSEPEEEG